MAEIEPTQSEPTNRRKRLVLVLLLASIVLAVMWPGVSYYYQQQNLHRLTNSGATGSNSNATGTFATANELIDYGNGTRTWYNMTSVSPGQNSYELTSSVAFVDSYPSAGLGSHYVLGINHVMENLTSYWIWTLWVFCSDTNGWAVSTWGADYIVVEKNGLEFKLLTGTISLGTNTLAWYYQHPTSADSSTWQPPSGANKVSRCW